MDSIDVSAEVQTQLGALMWENLVLRAQIRKMQARVAELEGEKEPQPQPFHDPSPSFASAPA